MANTKRDKLFTLLLSEAEHARLVRMAAKRTISTGKRVSAGDVMREMAFGDTRPTDGVAGVEVRVKLLPEVAAAVKRAGVDPSKIVNDALIEQLQMTEACA